MPLPTGTTRPGASGLTRSEAAILAWKKRARAAPKPGALDPKIAARVKEILAGKQKKGEVAPKGKAPKPTGTPQEIANKNRASVAKQGGMDKLEGVMVRLNAGMHSDLEKGAHDELIKKGLAKRGADGTVTLSPAGKKWKSAADKGDVAGAGAALAAGQAGAGDAAAKETAKAGKQAEREKAKTEKVAAAQSKQAEKQKKLKQAAGKAKAKAAAKPAAKPADAPAKQAANRAKVAKDMADQDSGLSPSGSAALGDFADGKPLDEKTATQFESMGLTEKGSDGTHRLTSEGKAAAQAMSKGDTRGAIDAISRAKDKKQQGENTANAKAKAKNERDTAAAQKKPKATKTMSDTDDLAIKAGARHSKGDMEHLHAAAEHIHAAGGKCPDCPPDDAAPDPAAEQAIKGIMDNPAWYAQHECGDVMQACSALSTLTMLIQSELGEEDEDIKDVSQLVDAARTLVTFIGGELDELEGAAGDAAELPNSASVQTMKGIEIATRDDGEEIATIAGSAIKAIGDTGLVGGYLVKFGGGGDLSPMRDVFTKATNFGTHTKSDVWVHHRMLPGLGKKHLTNQVEIDMDDEGVFVKHLLDLRNAYEAKLYGMVQAGKLGWSSGTAPHLVERKALGDGRHEITQWPLGLDASYTPMPAGGFVVNAGAMKSIIPAFLAELGYEAINEEPEAVKADTTRADGLEVDQSRARRILLELDILQLEETAR